MSEPDAHQAASPGLTLEQSADEILRQAPRLPWNDEMIIEGLTEDEEALFIDAVRGA